MQVVVLATLGQGWLIRWQSLHVGAVFNSGHSGSSMAAYTSFAQLFTSIKESNCVLPVCLHIRKKSCLKTDAGGAASQGLV